MGSATMKFGAQSAPSLYDEGVAARRTEYEMETTARWDGKLFVCCNYAKSI